MRRSSILCALLALVSLAGCGAPDSGALPEGSPAVSEETVPAETPAPDAGAAEDSGSGAEEHPPAGVTEEYTLEQPVTVDHGRTLTLRLQCRRVASGYGAWNYGVGSMDVLEGGELLQTLSVGEAMRAAEGADASDEEGWTHCYEGLYLPESVDLNFDGAEDIRLMEGLGTVNGRYLHWLWDPEAGQFRYGFVLVGYDFQIDADARQLVTEGRGGWGNYYTDYYQYDESGALQLVKEIHTEPPDWEGAKEGDFLETVHELVDGAWVQTGQRRVG